MPQVYEWATRLSEHLKPHTRAYHEIWLDGEKLAGTPEDEPIYGPTYLPRKFKARSPCRRSTTSMSSRTTSVSSRSSRTASSRDST